MKSIIRTPLTPGDLNNIALDFLRSHSGLKESKQETFFKRTKSLDEKLACMFIPYFERKDNSRYDYLVENMTVFCRALKQKLKNIHSKEECEIQKEYWRFIAEKIKEEAQLGFPSDNYLRNSVNYFDWKVKQVTA